MDTHTIYDWIMAYRKSTPIEILGLEWRVKGISFLKLPAYFPPSARIELSSPPPLDLAEFAREGSLTFIVKTEGYVPNVEDREAYLARMKREAIRQIDIQMGDAYRYLIDALVQHPEFADHEAIDRGRNLLRGGQLESREAMLAFIKSIE